jgi:acyl-coenzyme A thioesterase PaaI-like protein
MQTSLPRTRSCFVCGTGNPLGLNLAFAVEGQAVTARFTPRPEYAGFKDTVHGGLLSTVLDEVMVWACGVRTGRFAYCAELTVRFCQPARPGKPLSLRGELREDRRGRLFLAEAEARDAQGQLLASACGKYIPIPPASVRGMLDDFEGDIGQVIQGVT